MTRMLILDVALTAQSDAVVAIGLAGMAVAALGAGFSALMYSRSESPTPRASRSPQRREGVESLPEIDSTPFPNLLGKK